MKVIVKKSKIQGKGVFATRNIKKGEVVLKWDTSHRLKKTEVNELSEKEKNYVSYMNGKYVQMQVPEKYVNHSCEPNTHPKNHSDIAIRDIKKGEEITSDYSKESVGGTFLDCKCGSKKCKGRIKF